VEVARRAIKSKKHKTITDIILKHINGEAHMARPKIDPDKRNSEFVGFLVTKDEKERLAKKAEEKGVKVSRLVRDIVKRAIKR
jgi:hypothetical protein